MLAPTPFAHQVNIRLQQCCVVLVGVYPARPVVCRRFQCFLPGSLLGTTGHMARSPPELGVGVLCCRRGLLPHCFYLLIACLSYACRHALRSLVIGRSIDQCSRLYQTTMGLGSPS